MTAILGMDVNHAKGTDPMLDSTRRHLHDVHSSLLHLHKVLLDGERIAYEREHGRVSAGELLKLVIEHRQFAWLHAISELVVRIDELEDGEEPAEEEEVRALLTEVRGLLAPAEDGSVFARNYFHALQQDPAAVLAHRQTVMVVGIAVNSMAAAD